jgi:predicted dehydrogenase
MKEKLNIGVIGLGGRGMGLLKSVILKFPDVNVAAVCDLCQDRAEEGAKAVRRARGTEPFRTSDYAEVLEKDLDAVIIMTSWESHSRIAVDAMKKGIIPGMEVGGAYSVEECWELVNTSEKTGVPCMMLENCCYGRYELMALNMAQQGVFGEIVHCAGGYHHDLRHEISYGKENRHYRLNNYLNRNCENYPTHELGPIAKILKINRGNQMLRLVSMATKSAGLHEYILNKKKDDRELADARFRQGDIVSTLITCANGETIALTLDTTLPRHYSRGFTVRGTKGMYTENGNYVFLDGFHKVFDFMPQFLYGNGRRYERKYRHPLWKDRKENGVMGGHGGMDGMVFKAFFDAIKKGGEMPIDVYDTAAWMVITPLSEISIAENRMVDIPDFTRGKWKINK